MPAIWAELGCIVGDFDQITGTQRGHLIAPKRCDRQHLSGAVDRSHPHPERCVVARPFEPSDPAFDRRMLGGEIAYSSETGER